MARRRKARSRTAKSRRSWKLPRFRLSLRWLAVAWAMLRARLNPGVLRRGAVGISWTAALAVIVGSWILGVPRLQAFASQQRYSREVHVRFLNAPRWFNGDLAAHLTETAEMNLGGDPMRRDDLVACREALLQTGWFDSISQVRRVAPDSVEVDGQFAHPYAVIRDEEGDHLIDAAGRLLPLKYQRGAKTNFIAITGAHFKRPHECGEVWEGADVIAGLRLLQIVDQQPWRAQVTEIDITGHLRGEPMRLRTDRGVSILWGGAPGEEPALELLAEGKLRRLSFLFQKWGRIDGSETSGELDFTNEKAVVTRD
jgi:hypothetical protein